MPGEPEGCSTEKAPVRCRWSFSRSRDARKIAGSILSPVGGNSATTRGADQTAGAAEMAMEKAKKETRGGSFFIVLSKGLSLDLGEGARG